MNDWIERVDRLDNLLHEEGVSDAARILIVATYANALIQAQKARLAALKNVDTPPQVVID